MCGRYTQTLSASVLQKRFGFKDSHLELRARYNLAPSQMAPVIIDDGQKTLRLMRWGLVPSWSKEQSSGVINARAETLDEKPSFKKPFQNRRCLIPADSFFEWASRIAPDSKSLDSSRSSGAKSPINKGKIPLRFMRKDREPFAFAGLWDLWGKKNSEGIRTFTIITVPANDLVGKWHERMPAILRPEDENLWLDPRVEDKNKLMKMLKPYPSSEMEHYEVSPKINTPVLDSPEVVEPRTPAQL